MVQTKMRPIRDTIPLDEALALIDQAAVPIDRVERVTLPEAAGRVLARDVISGRDVPPFDRAAMDGYAVVAEDTFGATQAEPRILRCVEKVLTGQVPGRSVDRGECAEIATGAPMPSGADARGDGRGHRQGRTERGSHLYPGLSHGSTWGAEAPTSRRTRPCSAAAIC